MGFALPAVTSYLKLVALDRKIVFLCQLFFKPYQRLFLEFDGLAAFYTPKMTMVLVAVDVLIVKVAIFKIGLLNQTGLQQIRNQAIDGWL